MEILTKRQKLTILCKFRSVLEEWSNDLSNLICIEKQFIEQWYLCGLNFKDWYAAARPYEVDAALLKCSSILAADLKTGNMKVFLVKRANCDYDEFDSVVVRATNEEDARFIASYVDNNSEYTTTWFWDDTEVTDLTLDEGPGILHRAYHAG